MTIRVAYLVGRYPAVSHTFIQREILALRERGVEVNTISIHRAGSSDLLAERDRAEAATTFAVLPTRWWQLVSVVLVALARRPGGCARALATAIRLARPGLRGLVWELFYLAEGIVVWDHCRRLQLRHIHVHHLNQASDAAMLAICIEGPRRGWSWSFTMHGPDEFADVRDYRLPQKAQSAAAIACISDYARAQVMPLIQPEEWPKLHLIRCGLFLEQWKPPVRPIGARPFRILFVGRMVAVKGQHLLLTAISSLVERGVVLEVVFVGDGPVRRELESRVTALQLESRVRILGAVGQDEVGALFASSDVLVLASSAEGLPVVLMEAMAMQLPVVSTRIAGIPELVEDGVNGFLVPAGRSDLLTERLEQLARDPELRQEFGRRGRDKVAAEFDVRQSAAQLEKMFVEIMAR